jgi:DnaK suppressor protein
LEVQESIMTNTTTRTADLRRMLSERRREVQDDVQTRIRHSRADRTNEVRDDLEHSDDDIQAEIEHSLLQMRADTVIRIDAALVRLDAGKYGSCFDCERDIAVRRLRALPFAVRCQACEEHRENARCQGRRSGQSSSLSLFPELLGA